VEHSPLGKPVNFLQSWEQFYHIPARRTLVISHDIQPLPVKTVKEIAKWCIFRIEQVINQPEAIAKALNGFPSAIHAVLGIVDNGLGHIVIGCASVRTKTIGI